MQVDRDSETLRALTESGIARGGLFCVEVDIPSLGFFAHLGGVMSMLRLCERLALKPCIRLVSSNYLEPARGPSFLEYFFDGPVLSAAESRLVSAAPLTRIESFFDCPGWSQDDFPTLAKSHGFWSSYYSLRPGISAHVEQITSEKRMGIDMAGIHYRGTDKIREAAAVDPDSAIRHIKAALALHPGIERVFVASDSRGFPDMIASSLHGFSVSYCKDELRSSSDKPIHLAPVADQYRLGHEALVNCLLLAKCGVLVKNMSDLSGWASVFNPSQKVYLMNRPSGEGLKWLGFPERELIERDCFVPGLR